MSRRRTTKAPSGGCRGEASVATVRIYDIPAEAVSPQPTAVVVTTSPLAASEVAGPPVARTRRLEDGRPYEAMEPAYTAIASWIRAHGGEPAGDPGYLLQRSDAGAGSQHPATRRGAAAPREVIWRGGRGWLLSTRPP